MPAFALRHAVIFTVDQKNRVIADGTLVVEDGIITRLGDAREVVIPEGCEVIDAQGQALLPGLVDCHSH